MKGLTTEEYQRLILSVKTHRRDRVLSPLEVAQLLGKAVAAGTTRKECSEALQVGNTQVTAFLNLLKLAPEIQEFADWGNSTTSTIAFSTLGQLNVLSPETQRRAAEAILQYGLAWKEVVQLVQISQRSMRSIDEAIQTVVGLRPQVERRHVFIGSVKPGPLQDILRQRSQRERDELLDVITKELFLSGPEFGGRLGAQHFTIVGPSDPAKVLGITPDKLEETLGQRLLDRCRS